MQRVIVTGGSGFIGTNLVEHFLSQGVDAINIDIAPPRCPGHAHLWRNIDVRDSRAIADVVQEVAPDYLFHLAARTDLEGKTSADYLANTDGVRNVIAAARKWESVKRVVLASSMLVCRVGYQPKDEFDYCPTTAYGESKVIGEMLVRENAGTRFAWCIVRPTSIWGPWFDVPYRQFFDAVRAGWYAHPRAVRVCRNYGFVLNSIFQLDCLATAPARLVQGRTFYIADYVPVELRAWAEMIRRAFGAPPIREVPYPLLSFLARGGDILKASGIRNPPLSSLRLRNLVTEAVLDLASTAEITGPLPYGIEEGVRLTAQWMKRNSIAK